VQGQRIGRWGRARRPQPQQPASPKLEIHHEEIRGRLRDALASSLSDSQAAAVAAARLDGATPEQLLAAAIDMLREQAESHAEIVAGLRGELADLLDRNS
jgi:hypothetical protein